jgi:hypothetical protein
MRCDIEMLLPKLADEARILHLSDPEFSLCLEKRLTLRTNPSAIPS